MEQGDHKPKRIPWEDLYHLLEQFVSEYYRLPKRKEVYHNIQLGDWCSNQKRRVLQSGDTARIQKLQAIGLFDEDAGYLQHQWERQYRLLETFIAEKQRMPQVTEVYQGVNLGAWYSAQKGLLHSDTYPVERRAKIEALGITPATAQDDWEQHYQELQSFMAEYHRMPKQKEEYRGFKLGLWCTRQRQRAKLECYSAARRKKLEQIGLLQSENSDESVNESMQCDYAGSYRDSIWDARYQLLCAFIAEHGRLPHAKEQYQDTAIGQWYATQKSKMKKDGYPPERKEKIVRAANRISQQV